MNNLRFALEGAWKELLAGLKPGAGLPLRLALGIRTRARLLAYGAGGHAEVHASGGSGPAARSIGTVVAWSLFVIVLLAVVLGITFIVAGGFGEELSLEHIYPTIADK